MIGYIPVTVSQSQVCFLGNLSLGRRTLERPGWMSQKRIKRSAMEQAWRHGSEPYAIQFSTTGTYFLFPTDFKLLNMTVWQYFSRDASWNNNSGCFPPVQPWNSMRVWSLVEFRTGFRTVLGGPRKYSCFWETVGVFSRGQFWEPPWGRKMFTTSWVALRGHVRYTGNL